MKNLAGLMKQASQMQAKMAEMQAKLEAMEIEGSAGAGMVTVTLTGNNTYNGATTVNAGVLVAGAASVVALAHVMDVFGAPPPGDPSEHTGPLIGFTEAIDDRDIPGSIEDRFQPVVAEQLTPDGLADHAHRGAGALFGGAEDAAG